MWACLAVDELDAHMMMGRGICMNNLSHAGEFAAPRAGRRGRSKRQGGQEKAKSCCRQGQESSCQACWHRRQACQEEASQGSRRRESQSQEMILPHHQDLCLERNWQQVTHLSIMTERTDSCMHVMRSLHCRHVLCLGYDAVLKT